MKKKQRKVRLIRAAIQLIFFIVAPSLFSTAFAGIKSIFLAIGGQQSVTWNSFLDITALLLIITILFGRHFCGYACAFGSLGDALYELTAFIRAKCFGKKKKHGYPEEWVHRLQKVKYVLLAFLLLSCMTGFYSKLQGMSPWDVFSMLTTGRLPKSTYIVGIVLLILIMAGMCTCLLYTSAAKNTAGVKDATVNFMMLKMIVEFEDGQDPKAVMKDVLKNCKKVEDDCEIYL